MDDNFYLCLGQRVRQARRKTGMTQALLATRASVTVNIEKGRKKVLAHTLWRLVETLGVSPEDLVQEFAIVGK